MYYDNNVFRNVLQDRVSRLANGAFNAQANDPCASHGEVIFPGNIAQSAAGLCGQPIGSVASQIAGLQTAFQAANALLSSSSPNPGYLGQSLSSQQGMLAPNYQTPRSVQMNIGFQKQMWSSTVLSVDYVRNVGTHYLIGYDTNHVGDASHLDQNAALHAINCHPGREPAERRVSSCRPRRRQFPNRGELLPLDCARSHHRRLCEPRTGFWRAISRRPSCFRVWLDADWFAGDRQWSRFSGNQSAGGTQHHVLSRRPVALQRSASLAAQPDLGPDARRSQRQPAGFLLPIPASAAILRGVSATRTCFRWRRISIIRSHFSVRHRKTANTRCRWHPYWTFLMGPDWA